MLPGTMFPKSQVSVRFPVPLYLRDLVHRLPFDSLFDIELIKLSTGVLGINWKHDAVRQVAIVR
jgi:hypothetical protein